MRLSELVAKLNENLRVNGDAEAVTLAVTVAGTDGKRHRLDAVIGHDGDMEIIRDQNFVNGMACLIADHHGRVVVTAPASAWELEG